MSEYVHAWGDTVYFTPDDNEMLTTDWTEHFTSTGMLIIDLDRFIADRARAYFHRCELTNLTSFLQTNRNVTHLKLVECILKDGFSFEHVNTITRFEVDNTTANVDGVPPEVDHLSLQNLPELKSIDFMRTNTSIWHLELKNTGVRSLEPLRFNRTVTSLVASDSPIESLEPLRSNRTIVSLCVTHLPTTVDLTPIWGNTSIVTGAVGYSQTTRLQAHALTKTFKMNALNSRLRHITLRSLSKPHV